MKQISIAVFFSCTVVCCTAAFSIADVASQTTNASRNGQAISAAQAPVIYQSFVVDNLLMAQNSTTKKEEKKEKKEEKQEKKTSERIDNYKCLEYCSVVRQSCEALATVQPNVRIATIGSKENTQWSKECQKIYHGCTDKCDIDESKVNWKRFDLEKSKKTDKK